MSGRKKEDCSFRNLSHVSRSNSHSDMSPLTIVNQTNEATTSIVGYVIVIITVRADITREGDGITEREGNLPELECTSILCLLNIILIQTLRSRLGGPANQKPFLAHVTYWSNQRAVFRHVTNIIQLAGWVAASGACVYSSEQTEV